jgi:uncharacterized DUF497 family protein
MEFDWDPKKSDANRKKQGVSFYDAAKVFADPQRTIYENG